MYKRDVKPYDCGGIITLALLLPVFGVKMSPQRLLHTVLRVTTALRRA